MKRRLMKYAMMYIGDLVEDAFPDDQNMTVEKFIDLMGISFEYSEKWSDYPSRSDATLVILEHGEEEARFTMSIAR